MVRKNKDTALNTFIPQWLQIQAAIYLGAIRLSCFAYSQPVAFNNLADLKGQKLTFFKPKNKGVVE